MTRTAAVTYLGGIYGDDLLEVGLTATDDDANLGPAIDDALLALGTIYDDLATTEVASGDVIGYRVLLRYFGLLQIYEPSKRRVPISGGNPSASKGADQYPKEIRARLIDLAKQAANYGLTVGPGWQSATTIGFDFLEPMVWP